MEETPNNKGNMPQRIAERLVLLRDYLNANASKTPDFRDFLRGTADALSLFFRNKTV